MNRFFTFIYGTASYLVFLATFLYAIGFIGNFGVPKSLDTAASAPGKQPYGLTSDCCRCLRCNTALWPVPHARAYSRKLCR